MTTAEIIDRIGTDALQAALGVSRSSIKEARRGKFPARWYPVVKRLCCDLDIELPMSLFNWIEAAPMTLDQYLRETGEKGEAFAERIGTSAANVSRWRNGRTIPKPEMISRISKVTDGKVGLAAWHPSLAGLTTKKSDAVA